MLNEQREEDKAKFTTHQQIVKRWFDKHKAKDFFFEVGDLVLKWDKSNASKGKHSKFQNLWLRPTIAFNPKHDSDLGDGLCRLHLHHEFKN
jgi:hypothetical protein